MRSSAYILRVEDIGCHLWHMHLILEGRFELDSPQCVTVYYKYCLVICKD